LLGLEVKDIHAQYGTNKVLNGVSLGVEDGKFVTLLGPSGCGKTTLLRVVAGFNQPTKGEVYIKGERVDRDPPYKRDVGLVFQNYALFPHMTIFNNVAYGLKLRKLSRSEISDRVKEALDLVRLSGYEDRLPKQLSGGEQQRIAMARALVIRPRILLLDEPLSNLDLKLRQHLRLEIKSIQSKTRLTTLYVTHDQTEALVMSDQVAVLKNGIIQQLGSPTHIYEYPSNRFVADFVGEGNVFEGKFSQEGIFTTEDGLNVQVSESRTTNVEKAVLYVRPEKILITKVASAVNSFPGRIKQIVYEGPTVRYLISLTPKREILAVEQITELASLRNEGDDVYVSWSPDGSAVVAS
jgi:spermidine/putrescine ABC transporter ATP-binding subunit